MRLLADAVVLLRALALLPHPPHRQLLEELLPQQTMMEFAEPDAGCLKGNATV